MQTGAAAHAKPRSELQATAPDRRAEFDHHVGLTGEARKQLLELAEGGQRDRARIEAETERTRCQYHLCRLFLGLADLVVGRLEALDLLGHQARLLAVLMVDPSPHDHDRVRCDGPFAVRERLSEHEHLHRGLEVIEGREHHRVALLRCGSASPG